MNILQHLFFYMMDCQIAPCRSVCAIGGQGFRTEGSGGERGEWALK